MGDVFVSYARPDEEIAARVALALRARGFSVWRDNLLRGDTSFAREIEAKLTEAKVVLVLWSSQAAASDWVRAEADSGRQQGKLVQARLDATLPPIPFNQFQCHDIADRADAGDGFDRLVASIELVAGTTSVAAATAAPASPAPGSDRADDMSMILLRPLEADPADASAARFASSLDSEIVNAIAPWTSLRAIVDGSPGPVHGSALVLRGRVRADQGQVRAALQLTRAQSGELLWSRTFDAQVPPTLAAEAEIAVAVASAVETTAMLDRMNRTRNRRSSPADPTAAALRAGSLAFDSFERSALEDGLRLLAPFIDDQPRAEPVALVTASVLQAQLWLAGWSDDLPACRARAFEMARSAVRSASDDAFVLSTAGGALNLAGARIEEVARLLGRAELLNPNSPMIAFHMGWLHVRRAEARQSVDAFDRLLATGQRSPFAPFALAGRAAGLLMLGDVAGALGDVTTAAELQAGSGHPSVWIWLAAALRADNRVDMAQALAREKQLRPDQAFAMMAPDMAEGFVRTILEPAASGDR